MKEGGYIKVHEGLLVSIEPNALTLASQRTRKAFANGKEKGGRRTLEASPPFQLPLLLYYKVDKSRAGPDQAASAYLLRLKSRETANKWSALSPSFSSFYSTLPLFRESFASNRILLRVEGLAKSRRHNSIFPSKQNYFFFSKLEIMFIKFDSLKEEEKEK